MTQKNGLEILKTIRDLEIFYEDNLRNGKLMATPKIRRNTYFTLSLMLLGIVPMVISIFKDSNLWMYVGLTVVSIAFIFTFFIIRSSRKHLLKTLPEYDSLLNKSLLKFEEDILLAYRVDSFETELIKKNIDTEKTKLIIDFLSNKSETIKATRWFPISVSTIIFFPIWSEFVGVQIANIITLIILSFIITLFVLAFSQTLKSLLWSEALRYDQLTRILKLVLNSETYIRSQN
ncbi:hypothetical protein A8L34_01000 [Bacillus sp. FJAT-27264]|uniref:hypothetical protein n=1 Tax=Paenibacillus sp. (strain DSM 101736 / FJAT-27264) TaxID=1850362 RepID=UPI000807D74F|nr:hypothetical protein [Bacillus sp. FJAT-27264]OBZ18195.1 hypothetical protein A8L34_01000 [Bacillus sp. FJAT-27264]